MVVLVEPAYVRLIPRLGKFSYQFSLDVPGSVSDVSDVSDDELPSHEKAVDLLGLGLVDLLEEQFGTVKPDSEPAKIFATLLANEKSKSQAQVNEQRVRCSQSGPAKAAPVDKSQTKTHEATSGGPPKIRSDAELEAALRPAFQRIALHSKELPNWWRRPSASMPLLCPLTGFPICFLPYPPFKVHVDGNPLSSRRFVDGKFLAMRCIMTGQLTGKFANGQDVSFFDIGALDAYIRRCKLGQCRTSDAAALTQEVMYGATAEDRKKATQELERFTLHICDELKKLQHIQTSRLQMIKKALPPHMQAMLRDLQQSCGTMCNDDQREEVRREL